MAMSPIINTSVFLMHFGGVKAIPGIQVDVDTEWLTHPRVVVLEGEGKINLAPPPPADQEPSVDFQRQPQRPPNGAQQPTPPPQQNVRPPEGSQMPAPQRPVVPPEGTQLPSQPRPVPPQQPRPTPPQPQPQTKA